jgi:hypothetical protein
MDESCTSSLSTSPVSWVIIRFSVSFSGAYLADRRANGLDEGVNLSLKKYTATAATGIRIAMATKDQGM